MPLKNYGILKGKAIEVRPGAGQNPHYQVHIVDDTTDYRIAINVQSKLAPSELEYLIDDRFSHPILALLEAIPSGFTKIASKPGTSALDYIRANLFDRTKMRPLPFNLPGLDNDLNEKIHNVMQRAVADEDAVVYAFGERWGPEKNKKDKYFGFLPGNGIHDIHMNQSNVGQFVGDDGVWQDGGVIVQFPTQGQWVGVFLKFQSQGWHTDDKTGHKIGEQEPQPVTPGIPIPPGPPPLPTADDPQGLVRIVAALVNSVKSPEVEVVTLVNASPRDIKLQNWSLVDGQKNKQKLSGALKSGEARAIRVEKPVALSNKGGIITILDETGLKVDGVSYTKAQASNPGWTIVF
ncbi:MAG TPA: YukJ family protein [Pyrinomonadaceae bacterium]|nr:YukJ family protein [Pyrinomonadaceae bacterium]